MMVIPGFPDFFRPEERSEKVASLYAWQQNDYVLVFLKSTIFFVDQANGWHQVCCCSLNPHDDGSHLLPSFARYFPFFPFGRLDNQKKQSIAGTLGIMRVIASDHR